MNAKSKWLQEKDGNIIIPKTLDSQTFDNNGNSLAERLRGIDDSEVIQLPKVDPTMILSDLDYSTEEQLTGKRWTDGKPIYQKTVVWEGSATRNSFHIEHGIENLETIVTANLIYKRDTEVWNDLSQDDNLRYNITGTVIAITNNSWDTMTKIIVTILYTKTIDTTSSPVAPPKVEAMHNYSTEEKVVGTWIDGRPIYKRTWQFENTTATNPWDVNNVDFENIAFIISATLYDTDSDTPRCVPVKTRKLSSTSIRFYTGDSWGSIDAYNIQYVKTTDIN